MEGIVKYCVKINEVIDYQQQSLGERKMRSNGERNVSIQCVLSTTPSL